MSTNKDITLYLDNRNPPPVVSVSQGDTDWLYRFTIKYNDATYAPSVNYVILTGHKPDGHVFAYRGAKSGNLYTVTPASTNGNLVQMTAVAGDVPCELRLISSSRSVGTLNFILRVEPGPEGVVTVASSSALPAYATILAELQRLLTQAESIPGDVGGYITAWLVENITSGAVVDQSFTVENAAADAKLTGDRLKALEEATIETDATLTVAGAAADAKAVGDALLDTVPLDVVMWRSCLSTSGSGVMSIVPQANSFTAAFHVPANASVSVVVTGNKNRFKVLGTTELVPLDAASTVNEVAQIYDNSEADNYTFSSENYRTIFVTLVYNDSTLSPVLTGTVHAIVFKDQIAALKGAVQDVQQDIDDLKAVHGILPYQAAAIDALLSKAYFSENVDDALSTFRSAVGLAPAVAVTGVSLIGDTHELEVGERITITPAFTPTNATNKMVAWSTTTPEILSVGSDGKVQALAEGSGVVKVTIDDGGLTALYSIAVGASAERFVSLVVGGSDPTSDAPNTNAARRRTADQMAADGSSGTFKVRATVAVNGVANSGLYLLRFYSGNSYIGPYEAQDSSPEPTNPAWMRADGTEYTIGSVAYDASKITSVTGVRLIFKALADGTINSISGSIMVDGITYTVRDAV